MTNPKRFHVYAVEAGGFATLMWEGRFPEGSEDQVVLEAFARDLGYESYEYMCSTEAEGISNPCKDIVKEVIS